jgi:SAM-dependent methyltransferase
MARGYWQARVLITAVEHDFFTFVARGAGRAPEVAMAARTDARATELVLNALVGLGLLEKRDGRYSNTPEAEQFLVADSETYIGGGFGHYNYIWDSWSQLDDVVRTGEPATPSERFPDATERFMAAMASFSHDRTERVADLIELDNVKRALDLGGGPGQYACAFARRNASLEAVVFDRPAVAPIAERGIAAAGLSDRVSTLTGDFLVDDIGEGYDLILGSAIIHSCSPAENELLYAKCHAALNDGGRFVIQDFILDESKTSPASGALFAINMLVNTEGGASWSEPEVRGWLAGAGFSAVERVDTEVGTTLMIGTR